MSRLELSVALAVLTLLGGIVGFIVGIVLILWVEHRRDLTRRRKFATLR